MRKVLFFSISTLLLVAAMPFQPTAPTRYSDTEFAPADWQMTVLSNNIAIRARAEQRPTAGNPGAFRLIEHDLPADHPSIDSPHVVSLHRYLPVSYEAAQSGAIESICYEEEAFVIQGFGQGQGTGAALWQAGRFYVAAAGNTNVPASWRHLGPRVFQQDDFYELLPGAERDLSSHPDFSTGGAPIDLGFFRTNTSRTSGYVLVGAIDNWAVEINCEVGVPPAPTSMPSPSPEPVADCVCSEVALRVPAAIINDALANPERFQGWREPLDPGKPPSPANPPRECLTLRNAALDFHPLWNAPLWRVGCH